MTNKKIIVFDLSARGAVDDALKGKANYNAKALIYGVIDKLYKASYAANAFPENEKYMEKIRALFDELYPEGASLYNIVKSDNHDYFYLEKDDAIVTDEDGNTIEFQSYDAAQEYIDEIES